MDTTIENLVRESNLAIEEYEKIIEAAKEKIKNIKQKEREELFNKIQKLAQEKNLLNKPIYTKRDIHEITKAPMSLINTAIKEIENDTDK